MDQEQKPMPQQDTATGVVEMYGQVQERVAAPRSAVQAGTQGRSHPGISPVGLDRGEAADRRRPDRDDGLGPATPERCDRRSHAIELRPLQGERCLDRATVEGRGKRS